MGFPTNLDFFHPTRHAPSLATGVLGPFTLSGFWARWWGYDMGVAMVYMWRGVVLVVGWEILVGCCAEGLDC
jgi:hypothetical protein